jgi:hypothetical protein
MFGTANGTAAAARPVPLAGPAPTPNASNGRPQGAAMQGTQTQAAGWTPWVLLALLLLWVGWALVERHQKVRNLVQPKAIGLNLRNLAAIILPVILALSLLRLALVKLNVFLSGVPYVQPLVGALIQLVG